MLLAQVHEVISTSRPAVVEGIDPRWVFKVHCQSRVADSAFTARELAILGETADWVYFVITSDGEAERLLADLRRYAEGPDQEGAKASLQTVFGKIHSLKPYGPEDRRGPGLDDLLGDEVIVDVQVWPSPDIQEAAARVAQVRQLVERTDGAVLQFDERPQSTVVRSRVTSEGLGALLELTVVERVRTPPMPYLPPTDWLHTRLEALDVTVEDSEPVGVIDDGIVTGHPLLQDLVRGAISVPDGHVWPPPSAHATMVAGLAAYGDFEGPLRDGASLVGRGPIYGARILEPYPGRADRTRFPLMSLPHQATEEAIRELQARWGVRVFNLSATDDSGFTGPHVDTWTERIDHLVRELGIVVVVSAGNVLGCSGSELGSGHDVVRDYPAYTLLDEARVSEPGIAALALTVGSVARSTGPATPDGKTRLGDQAIAPVNGISPFSRTGPGVRGKAVKPDVVSYGGNWVLNDFGRLDPKNAGVGVVSLTGNGTGRLFDVACGTSFAAPRVARLAADVWDRYPKVSANLVRCLVGLAAHQPDVSSRQFLAEPDRYRAYGHGLVDPPLALESGGNRVVLYADTSMPTDSVAVLAVPIPERFATGRSARRIRCRTTAWMSRGGC